MKATKYLNRMLQVSDQMFLNHQTDSSQRNTSIPHKSQSQYTVRDFSFDTILNTLQYLIRRDNKMNVAQPRRIHEIN